MCGIMPRHMHFRGVLVEDALQRFCREVKPVFLVLCHLLKEVRQYVAGLFHMVWVNVEA